MNTELLILKGAISEMPQADQDRIYKAAQDIRAIVADLGELGNCALGMVAAELAIKELGRS